MRRHWKALVEKYNISDKAGWKSTQNGTLLPFMKPPVVLRLLQPVKGKIYVYGSFFEHVLRKAHAGMTLDIVKFLPAAMKDPLMIIKGSHPDSFVFVLNRKDANGATIVVPLTLHKMDRNLGCINVVNSAYGKTKSMQNPAPSYQWFYEQICRNNVLYLNKEKSAIWVAAIRNSSSVGTQLHSALLNTILLPSRGRVKDETDLFLAQRRENRLASIQYLLSSKGGLNVGKLPLNLMERKFKVQAALQLWKNHRVWNDRFDLMIAQELLNQGISRNEVINVIGKFSPSCISKTVLVQTLKLPCYCNSLTKERD